LERETGVEPATSSLARKHSTTELLPLAKFTDSRRELEARVGIEPTHKGFADLSLTTWVPRLGWASKDPHSPKNSCSP
jgi:hypothetical protein